LLACGFAVTAGARAQPPAGPAPRVIATSRVMPPAADSPAPLPALDGGPELPPPDPPAPPAPGPMPGGVRQAVYQPEPAPAGAAPSAAAPGSQVMVEALGPAAREAGQPLAYDIVARNTGTVVVATVRVEDRLPTGARLIHAEPAPTVRDGRLSWELGNLEAGAERRLRVEIQPAADEDVVICPTVTYSAAVGLRARVVRPPFAVRMAAPESARRGEAVALRVTVANNGTAPLEHVVVRVRLPAGLRHPQGDEVQAEVGALKSGEERVLPLEVRAVAGGRLTAEVSARADGAAEARASAAVTVADAALAVKLDGPPAVAAGREAELRLGVANAGPAAAAGVRLTAAVPEGLEVLGVSTGGNYDPATRTLSWPVGLLGGGQARAVFLTLRGQSAGEWAVRAAASAEGGAEAGATHALRVDGPPDVLLEVADRGGPVPAGGEVTYEVRAHNKGHARSGVRLTVELPEGLRPVRADGPAASRLLPQGVAFDPLPQLGPQDVAVYHVRAAVERPGNYRVRFDLLAEGMPQPVSGVAATRVVEGAGGAAAGR
jgi:uncharacterized repeat protein (TIGR01451 family)